MFLDELTNVHSLVLMHNQIYQIKGLENLKELKSLRLIGNKIPSKLFKILRSDYINDLDPQKCVEYCQRQIKDVK